VVRMRVHPFSPLDEEDEPLVTIIQADLPEWQTLQPELRTIVEEHFREYFSDDNFTWSPWLSNGISR
jgi:hypothetical protein